MTALSTPVLDGIDTSKWQLKADWAGAARATGFIIAKATEGLTETDSNYLPAIAAARAAGKPCGSYHYTDGNHPAREAAHYVAHNSRRDGELQVLDFEGVVLKHADAVGYAVTWCSEVSRLSGNLPLIYMNVATLHQLNWSRLVNLNVGLWLASWGPLKPANTAPWPFAILWQRSDSARVTGIPADVDADYFYGDKGTWLRYGHTRTPAGPPAPKPAPKPAPAPAPKPPAPARPLYTVVDGDQLGKLCQRFGVSQAAMVAANVHNYPSLGWHPDLIQIGWRLTIPRGGHWPAPTPAPHGPGTALIVTVRAKETLTSIASAHGLTLAQLLNLNPPYRAHPDHVEAGASVRVR